MDVVHVLLNWENSAPQKKNLLEHFFDFYNGDKHTAHFQRIHSTRSTLHSDAA